MNKLFQHIPYRWNLEHQSNQNCLKKLHFFYLLDKCSYLYPLQQYHFFYVSPDKVDVHLFVALFIGSFRSNFCFIDNNLIKTKN